MFYLIINVYFTKTAVSLRYSVAEILHNFYHQPKEEGSEEKHIRMIETGTKAMTLDMSRATIAFFRDDTAQRVFEVSQFKSCCSLQNNIHVYTRNTW